MPDPVGQVCPGLTNLDYALLCASLRCFWHCFFWKYFFFEFAFCSVVLHLFLHKKLRNDWRWFCACINYCILWCGITCAVRILLLISMLVCLLFLIICTITFSPYFLQHFCALLTWFWGPIPHFCVFCCLHVCLDITSWSCAIIPCNILLLVVFWDSYAPFCQKKLVSWWSSRFYRFFWSDYCLLVFGCKIGLLHQFVFARFDIFVCFLAVVSTCPFDTFMHKPFACLNRSKLWLLLSLFGFLASPMLA